MSCCTCFSRGRGACIRPYRGAGASVGANTGATVHNLPCALLAHSPSRSPLPQPILEGLGRCTRPRELDMLVSPRLEGAHELAGLTGLTALYLTVRAEEPTEVARQLAGMTGLQVLKLWTYSARDEGDNHTDWLCPPAQQPDLPASEAPRAGGATRRAGLTNPLGTPALLHARAPGRPAAPAAPAQQPDYVGFS